MLPVSYVGKHRKVVMFYQPKVEMLAANGFVYQTCTLPIVNKLKFESANCIIVFLLPHCLLKQSLSAYLQLYRLLLQYLNCYSLNFVLKSRVSYIKMISGVDIDKCFNVAVKLASEAGEIIRSAMGKKKNIQTKKSNVDLVTETDKKVEEFLKKGFTENFPDHCFIGEESTTALEFTNAPTWIIDPVDGTMNFVHSYPYSAVSIGLTVEKEVVLGIVFNPTLGKMYSAIKGRGAFCNGRKIEVSDVKELSEALILSEVGSTRSSEVMEQVHQNFCNLSMKTHGMRMMGSAALNMCAVAAGDADGYFEYTLHCWDMAGGKIIVEEAGGVVIDPEGGPLDLMSRRVVCASCPELAQALCKELKHIQMPRD